MSILSKLQSIAESACPNYTFQFETKNMMNVDADDQLFPCIFVDEYYDGRYIKTGNRRYKQVAVDIHFLDLCDMQNTAMEREAIRERIEREALMPFMEALNADGMFLSVDDYSCSPEPPLFDANAVGLLVRVSLNFLTCSL